MKGGKKSQEPQSPGLTPLVLRVRMEKDTLGALEGVIGGGSGPGGGDINCFEMCPKLFM